MGFRDLVYRVYERRLEASLAGHPVPRHVGVILDGNRRWARLAGFTDVSNGHQKGADHIFELLGWCSQARVEVVTLWLLATDNLSRPTAELEPLLKIIEIEIHIAGGFGGCGFAVIEEGGFAIGQAHEHESAATDVSSSGLDHGENERRSDSGIHGVAATFQDIHAGLRSERLIRGYHAV